MSSWIWLWLGGEAYQEEIIYALKLFPPQEHIALNGGSKHLIEYALLEPLTGRPLTLIGDLDTLSQLPVKPNERLRYPEDKDETDLELALSYLRDRGYPSILVLGALSITRPDQVLVNLSQLARYPGRVLLSFRYGWALNLREGTLAIKLPERTRISLVAVEELKARSEGLRYSLSGITLSRGVGRGISNLNIRSDVLIEVIGGCGWMFVFTRDLKLSRWDVR